MKRMFGLCLLCAACAGGNEATKESSGGTEVETEESRDSADTEESDFDTASDDDNDSSSDIADTATPSDSSDTAGTGSTDDPSDSEQTGVCPDGSTSHTGSNGDLFCCSESYPVFCDANDDGYKGGCWSEGVACDTLTQCGDQLKACLEGSLPYCDADDNFVCYACPEGATQYETASGKPVCCSDARPLFCDENDAGYGGGCWSDGVDCDTIAVCGGSFTACFEGSLPFCDDAGDLTCYPCPEGAEQYETASGRPVCCTDDLPVFCDESAGGYTGGCWSEGVDCTTVIYCGGFWGACTEGRSSTCEEDTLRCISDASAQIISLL